MRMSRASTVAPLTGLLLCVSCAQPAGDERHGGGAVHWGYESHDGPDAWASMHGDWRLCAEGREQSPIDLVGAQRTELPPIEIDLPSAEQVDVLNQRKVTRLLDNGHTIQINAKSQEILTVADEAYALVQFHFHAPSEHTVDGEHFPMEIHFVHRAEDGALAVVGVFIEEGEHNPAIDPLWARLGAAPGTGGAVQMPEDFADHVFGGEDRALFHYGGSLTTPPCSEGVKWFIRRAPTRLSRAQIEAFTEIYDHNNRPVRPLHDRTLTIDEAPRVTVR